MPIIKLSELNAEEKYVRIKQYETLIEAGELVHANKDFNDYGLRFDVQYLNRIGLMLVLLPLEMMAEYVDVVTKSYVDKSIWDFDESSYGMFRINESQLQYTNATAIGNLAYNCLNSKDTYIKTICEQSLNKIHDYVSAKMIAELSKNKN